MSVSSDIQTLISERTQTYFWVRKRRAEIRLCSQAKHCEIMCQTREGVFHLISKKQKIGVKTEGLPGLALANFKQTYESSLEMKPFFCICCFVCLFVCFLNISQRKRLSLLIIDLHCGILVKKPTGVKLMKFSYRRRFLGPQST